MTASLHIETTLMFAAIFGILHVVFTLRVGRYRFKNKISLGDGGDKELRNRIRGHGNFIETVPIALLLLLLNDLNGLGDGPLMTLGVVLLVSRVVHYVMIVSRRLPMIFRPLSMLGTLGTILVSALFLVI
ncbi:MAG: MAPEG family protein [Parvibaculales bacterium]